MFLCNTYRDYQTLRISMPNSLPLLLPCFLFCSCYIPAENKAAQTAEVTVLDSREEKTAKISLKNSGPLVAEKPVSGKKVRLISGVFYDRDGNDRFEEFTRGKTSYFDRNGDRRIDFVVMKNHPETVLIMTVFWTNR